MLISSQAPGGDPAFSTILSYARDLIEGVEVHRNPANAPAGYNVIGSACGVVLMWTTGRR